MDMKIAPDIPIMIFVLLDATLVINDFASVVSAILFIPYRVFVIYVNISHLAI